MTTSTTRTCALRHDQTAWCWGANLFQLLGPGTDDGNRPPRPRAFPYRVTQMEGAEVYQLALDDSGRLHCMGLNSTGLLGVEGDVVEHTLGPDVVGDVVELAPGTFTACVRRRDDTVICWGSNALHVVGPACTTARCPPTLVPNL